ncbi:MAG: amidohydrolase [Myxococcota bacterium]
MRRSEIDKLILHGGPVRTLHARGPVASAIGFAGGRVRGIGTLEQVRTAVPGGEERDLHGSVVYPGFIDAHHHLCFAATYGHLPEIRNPPYRSLAQILHRLGELAASTPDGEWIVLFGYDEARLEEHRAPTRQELDRVAPAHPVLLIHFSYHQGVLNSLGLARTGLDAPGVDPPGGWRGRRGGGELDGLVVERCFGHAEGIVRRALALRDPESWFARANAYQDRLLAAGITHICDAAVPPEMESLYRAWQRRGELHVGVTMMPLIENIFAVPEARLMGKTTGWSEGRLSIGAMKLFMDGGTSCAICFSLRDAIVQLASMVGRLIRARTLLPLRLARTQSVRVGPDRRLHSGQLFYDAGGIEAMIGRASAAGFAIGVHAGGNEAIDLVLSAFARSYRGALPPRVDHFFFADEAVIRRAAREGVHAVVQPPHIRDTGELLLQTGIPGGLSYHAYRELLDGGVPLAGSSDAPVSSFDVLTAIEVAVTRQLPDGRALGPEQSLDAAEVLEMYTRGAAAVLGMEREIGTLAPGTRADAVVLSADPADLPPERLSEVGVLGTLAGKLFVEP